MEYNLPRTKTTNLRRKVLQNFPPTQGKRLQFITQRQQQAKNNGRRHKLKTTSTRAIYTPGALSRVISSSK